MDIEAILKQLREELAHINEGILAIERLAAGGHVRRGRPPKWLAAAKAQPKRRGRPRKAQVPEENE